MTAVISADANRIVESYRNSTHLKQRWWNQPPVKQPHELVVTGKKGKAGNGKILVVRCRCMAEINCKRNYYNYDPLGEVTSLPAAVAMYNQHLQESGETDAERTLQQA